MKQAAQIVEDPGDYQLTEAETSELKIQQIDIDLIEVGGGTQSRVELDDATVDDYKQAMQNGATFPPIDVYHDEEKYWLADGFHRLYAAKLVNRTTIAANVHEGTKRDAILHSVGANAAHGLRRSNLDKRRAVEILLQDEEWGKWSDNAIAKQCGVSQPFVSKLRTGTCPSYNGYKMKRTVNRNGATYVQNTENIGRIKKYASGTIVIDIKATPVADSEDDDLDCDPSTGKMPSSADVTDASSAASSQTQPERVDAIAKPVEEIKRLPQSATSADAQLAELDESLLTEVGKLPVGEIANSVELTPTDILADNSPVIDEDDPPPRAEQMRVTWEKTDELLEALKEAQGEIEQLRNERDELKERVERLTAELESVKQHKGFASPPDPRARRKGGGKRN
jgi:hypothetical protein